MGCSVSDFLLQLTPGAGDCGKRLERSNMKGTLPLFPSPMGSRSQSKDYR